MKLKRLLDRTFITYLIVGVLNFIVCNFLMFLLYNRFHVSEHLAPVVNYGLGSVIWFLSSRYLIFRDWHTTPGLLLRFALEVLVCYGLSYYIVAPLARELLLRGESVMRFFSFGGEAKIAGNCAMTVGMFSYAVLNYFGQRYFVFNRRFQKTQSGSAS